MKINDIINEDKPTDSDYAIGMAQAKKSTGDRPPLKKSTIKKAHKIARAVANEGNPCWDGYEKVPGKKDYEKGSCRKKKNEAADPLMGKEDPVVVVYNQQGKPVDRLALTVAADKYKFDAAKAKLQFKHQDKVRMGKITLSAPISGQPVDEATKETKFDQIKSCPSCGSDKIQLGYRGSIPAKRCRSCGWEKWKKKTNETEQIDEIFGFGKKAQMRRGAIKIASDVMFDQILKPLLSSEFKGAFEGIDIRDDSAKGYIATGHGIAVHLNVSENYLQQGSNGKEYYITGNLTRNLSDALKAKYSEWKNANADNIHSKMITAPTVSSTFENNNRHSDGNSEQNIVIRFRVLDGGINRQFESLEETYHGNEFYEAYGELWYNEDEQLDEAEYQGRKVKLGKPMRGDVKKFKVYVKNPKGNVVKVNFGDPDMRIKKSDPKRRKSFRARHNCDNPGPRHKARYWSCRKW